MIWPRNKSGGNLLVLLVLVCSSGCSEEYQDGVRQAAGHINSSGSGLVRIVEGEGERAAAKYLTAEYLAHAETQTGSKADEPFDSLVSRYSHTMSFYVTLDGKESGIPAMPTASGGEPEMAAGGGVMDVEAAKEMFRLKCGEHTWTPVCALPESRVGVAEQTWFVVFAVDPREALRGKSTVQLLYADPADGKVVKTFTYEVNDLIHS